MVKVKICGITNAKDAQSAVDLGAWALGFIFYKKSPRYVTPSKAKRIIAKLPPSILTVGVFVDEKPSVIKRIARLCGLKALQFHGNENIDFCRQFKGYKVIKVFRVNRDLDIKEVLRYEAYAYLFDTYKKSAYGGTGKAFDWKVLKRKNIKRPFILSGGLNPKNIARAIKTVKPYAVDASSGVEKSPGKKDKKLLKEFFRTIRSGNS